MIRNSEPVHRSGRDKLAAGTDRLFQINRPVLHVRPVQIDPVNLQPVQATLHAVGDCSRRKPFPGRRPTARNGRLGTDLGADQEAFPDPGVARQPAPDEAFALPAVSGLAGPERVVVRGIDQCPACRDDLPSNSNEVRSSTLVPKYIAPRAMGTIAWSRACCRSAVMFTSLLPGGHSRSSAKPVRMRISSPTMSRTPEAAPMCQRTVQRNRSAPCSPCASGKLTRSTSKELSTYRWPVGSRRRGGAAREA